MSFFRKLGRAIDPTSRSSPLGAVTRTVINAVPGGSAALGAVDAVNTARRAASTDSRPATDRGGTPAGVVTSIPAVGSPSPSMPASLGTVAWYRKPAVLAGAAASVVALLLVLVLGRRK